MNKILVVGTVIGLGLLLLLGGGEANAAPPEKDIKGSSFQADPEAETAACAWALGERPEKYGELTRAPGQMLSVWLAIVAWRRAYPLSPVSPASPDELAAFSRLSNCISTGLKEAPDKPAPQPAPLPPPEPNAPVEDPLTAAAPTAAERTVATKAWQERVALSAAPYPDAPDVAMRTRGSRTLKVWLANIIYWHLYANPKTSAWIATGKPGAPWRAQENPAWATVWTRIRDYLDTLPAPAPKGNVENPIKAQAPTAAERTAANIVAKSKPQTYPNAPLAIMQMRGNRTLKDWLANVVYWHLYADPATSAWQKDGGPEAPWQVNSDPVWIPVWKRIRAYFDTLPGL
jgi:hypothetical protein